MTVQIPLDYLPLSNGMWLTNDRCRRRRHQFVRLFDSTEVAPSTMINGDNVALPPNKNGRSAFLFIFMLNVYFRMDSALWRRGYIDGLVSRLTVMSDRRLTLFRRTVGGRRRRRRDGNRQRSAAFFPGKTWGGVTPMIFLCIFDYFFFDYLFFFRFLASCDTQCDMPTTHTIHTHTAARLQTTIKGRWCRKRRRLCGYCVWWSDLTDNETNERNKSSHHCW